MYINYKQNKGNEYICPINGLKHCLFPSCQVIITTAMNLKASINQSYSFNCHQWLSSRTSSLAIICISLGFDQILKLLEKDTPFFFFCWERIHHSYDHKWGYDILWFWCRWHIMLCGSFIIARPNSNCVEFSTGRSFYSHQKKVVDPFFILFILYFFLYEVVDPFISTRYHHSSFKK